MKQTLIVSLAGLFLSSLLYSQSEGTDDSKPRAFRLEMEPTSYIAKGWSVLGSYGITKDRNLHIGLYSIASALPEGLNERMFKNVKREDKIRLSFEIASTFRYKIPYSLRSESNPYIGLFFGWEQFRHTSKANGAETQMSNFFLTPQIGYEIYVYKERVYLNPSVRIVYEFGIKSDFDGADGQGPQIKEWLWLPSFSIGVRL